MDHGMLEFKQQYAKPLYFDVKLEFIMEIVNSKPKCCKHKLPKGTDTRTTCTKHCVSCK